MLVSDLNASMDQIAPQALAEPWDRVGMLVGDASRALAGPVFLTIDLTERVLDEAIQERASAIIAYHPPIWEPMARITASSMPERAILRAIESHIAIYCPHTALDAASRGISDWLCEGLSGGRDGKVSGDCRALTPYAAIESTQQVKLVTFVPPDAVDKVRSAMASAGAGLNENYSVCSFAADGTGTFFGNASSQPAVGVAGRLERVRECRLEMVCAKRAVALVIETLKQFHPYETMPIDVYELAPQPTRNTGAGRRLVLDQPATLAQLAVRLREHLRTARIEVASVGGPTDLSRAVSTIGVVPGAGGSLAGVARAEGCEVFVTGEMKHHDVLHALHSGMSVILAGHTNTERGYLPRLAERLRGMLPGVRVVQARADHDPLVVV